MAEANLFEEMLAAYPAEKRELARAVYHRFADGDSAQFFTQLLLVLDVHAHYTERIPTRMIAASADSVATLQELRGEIDQLAKTLATRHGDITRHAEKTDELCRITLAKCNETIPRIELTVKNIGAQVDTKAIVQGIQNQVETGLHREIIAPFLQRTEELAREVTPTLRSLRESADKVRSEWTQRIWSHAWATCLTWSVGGAVILTGLLFMAFASVYDHKMKAQFVAMTQVMEFNQAAFQTLAQAQVRIGVMPTQSDGFGQPPGYVLFLNEADAAEMSAGTTGSIYFHSRVSNSQIQHWQPTGQNPAPATNSVAK